MAGPDLNRNNLDRADSPYLRQHRDNPVRWQEWSAEVIEAAVRLDRPLFVSVGYATCHWCHVMAAEAFSDGPTADYLNGHFIPIKVDREQRPDIDQWLMAFITSQTGQGGWPLNAFLTPRLAPVYAFTYAPVGTGGGRPSLLEIAAKVHEYVRDRRGEIPPFHPPAAVPAQAGQARLVLELGRFHDPVAGGFGTGQKFPPHSTLLYLLYLLCTGEDETARRMAVTTLDAMRLRGLHDHLQGGIFRYCVDRAWTIPHFEKMLYDQAMALWCYALASRVLGGAAYRATAEGIVRCLEETFARDGLFISAWDADTDHREGGTYLWRYGELAEALTPEELAALGDAYEDIGPDGNFEGLIHLIRKTGTPLAAIEAKLLAIRRGRPQPQADDKLLCGLNALAAVAYVEAARLIGQPDLEARAAGIVRRLLALFWDGRTLAHAFAGGRVQPQSYLFDAAALLLAVSLLEETDPAWGGTVGALSAYLETFREGERWVESRAADFFPVAAAWFDHPIPSSAALAEMAQARVAVRAGREIGELPYRTPFQADFHNVTALLVNGLFHRIGTARPIRWEQLPPNTILVRGGQESDCYLGACRPLPAGQPGSGPIGAEETSRQPS